jgi:CBS domain-containing protein
MQADPLRALATWRVMDVMSSPIRSCAPDMPVAEAARLMVAERIHCLAVVELPEDPAEPETFLRVLSDFDAIAALDGPGAAGTAAEHAQGPLESVAADASLSEAVHQMHASRARHLVVVARGSGRAVGVLSTLDVLRALAEAPGEGDRAGS